MYHINSEWSATFTATGADSTITEEDNLNLMSSGACGAFIHGLEDECLEVRSEAVDALCSLAGNSVIRFRLQRTIVFVNYCK